MEILDLFDKNGNKLNKTAIRGTQLSKDEYCMGVDIWIKNNLEQILLTQRHPSKSYPLKWECCGGWVISGEDSLFGALREVEEEIGIRLNGKNGKKIKRWIWGKENMIVDVFLFRSNIEIKQVILQKDEVLNIQGVEKEEIIKMFKKNEMVEPLKYVCELINKEVI
jgi:8-oxo-dGTP pyrophosphatase MutT (NUDIX family)